MTAMIIKMASFDDGVVQEALYSYEALYADHDPHKYDHLFPEAMRLTDAETRNLISLLSKAKADLDEALHALPGNTMIRKLARTHHTRLDNGIETLLRLLRDHNA